MISFLEKIADRLLDKFPNNMDNIAVVLPSKRAAIFLKHYLSKKINKPIFLPDFYSIEEFIEKLSGLQVLDNISLQFRLYQIYLKNPPNKKDSFDDFLKWSNVLLHDFNEIDRNLVNAKFIYTNLVQVKELEDWNVEDWSFSNDSLTLMQNDYLQFFELMYHWYNDFSCSLLKEDLAYQGLAYREAVKAIKNLDITWEKIWFVGLNALTKAEQNIIDYLKDKNVARVFWDADKFYYDNPLHEAGSFLRNQSKQWSEIDFQGVGDYFTKKKDEFNIIACPKNVSQAQIAAELIKSLPVDDLEDSKTAIVLADETLLYPVLHHLPSEVKELNVTMGNPFKNTVLFAFIDELLTMQVHAIKYNRGGLYYKDFLRVIEHPYFVKIVGVRVILEFKRFIIKKNIVFISKDNIENIFKDNFIIDLLKIWKNNIYAINILTKLVEHLKQHVVGNSASVESEELVIFFKNIILLKKLLDENDYVFELKTLQLIIQQLVAKEMIPFQGEPLKGLQLMGILESRTLDFKNIIMLSVNEGNLPQGKSVNSFIPYDMKKYFKLPTYTESDAVFSYHFYRLLQRANTINLIYNSENDDFGSGERSRYITQLLAEYPGEIKQYVYKGNNLEINHSSDIIIKNHGLHNLIKSWAEKGVSPSALNKYISCSLQFYYHYLVKIRINDHVEEYADASLIGNAIHHTLETHYPLGILTKDYLDNKKDAILSDIESYFLDLFSHQGMQEGKNFLSLQITKRLIKNFLKLERKLVVNGNKKNQQIKVITKEEELSYKLLVDDFEFNLVGKVDRVDSVNNLLRIIDYKTGKVEDNELLFTDFNELIENPKKAKAFQLLMYAYLYLKKYPDYVNQDVIVGVFAFKNLNGGLLKLKRNKNKKESEVIKVTENIMDEFEQQLKILLLKIKNDDFQHTNDTKYCTFCDNKLIAKK